MDLDDAWDIIRPESFSVRPNELNQAFKCLYEQIHGKNFTSDLCSDSWEAVKVMIVLPAE